MSDSVDIVDFSDVADESDLGSRGPEPGRYHVQIVSIDTSLSEYESYVIEFVCLDGTTPGQRGRKFREWLSLSQKARKRLERFVFAAQLIPPGGKGRPNWGDAVGRQMIVNVVENSYEKDGETRTSVRIGFLDFWRCTHPDVDDVPRGDPISVSRKAAAGNGDDGSGDEIDL